MEEEGNNLDVLDVLAQAAEEVEPEKKKSSKKSGDGGGTKKRKRQQKQPAVTETAAEAAAAAERPKKARKTRKNQCRKICTADGCTYIAQNGGVCNKHGAVTRKQRKSFVIDLSDVPPQPPIPKNKRYVKEGASKYTGVSFNKHTNNWTAQIMIEGKQHTIGRRYDNEEEAAVDYARALFKYRGGVKDQEQRDSFAIDLSGVPPQPPIPKSSGRIKEGASKYTGVFLNQQRYKWVAQIRIEGRLLLIGYYDDEEEAAVDYARAVFKYKGGVVHPR